MVTECFSFLKLHTEEKGRSQIASECSKFEIKFFAGLQLVPRGIQGLVMVFLPERLDNRGGWEKKGEWIVCHSYRSSLIRGTMHLCRHAIYQSSESE